MHIPYNFNAVYHRINIHGNIREQFRFSVPVEKKQEKKEWLLPEPSKSARSGVKSPAKTLGTSRRESWSSQCRERGWKSLYFQIRPNLLNGPPVRLPPHWKLRVYWKEDVRRRGKLEVEEEVGGSVDWYFLNWETNSYQNSNHSW